MAQSTASPDPTVVDSKHYKVEEETDKVRILRARYGPGEKSIMHAHPPHTAIFITAAHVRFTFPDGTSQEANVPAGGVVSLGATTHSPENLGSEPVEAVLVEQKS